MPPSRRRLLHSSGLTLLGSLTGCIAGETATRGGNAPSSTPPAGETPQATGTYADSPDGPEPYPERPDDLTPASVRRYVKSYEFARTTNVLHEPDVEELSVRSRAVYDTSGQGGHYALAACRGYANYADGVHADWGQLPALFFVGPQLTVRVEHLDDHYFDCNDVFAADDPEENIAGVCEGGTASYRVYNLHPEEHVVSVTVEFLGDGDLASALTSTVALERTYRMGPATALRQESVTYRRGTYRLTAAIEGGPETTYQWELQHEPTHDDPPVSVVVTPVGGVAVRRPPFHEFF